MKRLFRGRDAAGLKRSLPVEIGFEGTQRGRHCREPSQAHVVAAIAAGGKLRRERIGEREHRLRCSFDRCARRHVRRTATRVVKRRLDAQSPIRFGDIAENEEVRAHRRRCHACAHRVKGRLTSDRHRLRGLRRADGMQSIDAVDGRGEQVDERASEVGVLGARVHGKGENDDALGSDRLIGAVPGMANAGPGDGGEERDPGSDSDSAPAAARQGRERSERAAHDARRPRTIARVARPRMRERKRARSSCGAA